MNFIAILLVLGSAILHATWNLYAKRVNGGDTTFLWLFSGVSIVCYAPLAIGVLVLERPHFGWEQIIYVLGSSTFHWAYFVALAFSYRTGDLSLVYPLARSSGPALAIVGAVLLLDEEVTLPLLVGSALIIVGSFILTGDPRQMWQADARVSVFFALLTGLTIAGYTLWDKVAVSTVMIPPILLDWFNNWTRLIGLAPHANKHREQVRVYWRDYRRETLVVALLGPLSYILLLSALVFSPVLFVSSLRQTSIIMGTWMGGRFLAEGQSGRRLLAASVMVGGVIVLALA